MKALAKEIGPALAFIAIGVVVSLAVVLAQGAEASPDPRVSWVNRGVTPFHGWQCAAWNQFPGWHECWHDNEPGQYSAIDYNRDEQTAGSGVWVDYDGDFELFKMLALPDWYNCKGVRAALYWQSYDGANYRGDVHYLHIDVNEWVIGEELDYQVLYIGDVAEEDNPGCSGWIWLEEQQRWYWPPHLHQSADYSASTPFCTNKLVDPSQGDNWQHKVFWLWAAGESDCDGFTDSAELFIGTDSEDDCTDQGGDNDAWPPDINADTWCNVLDVLLYSASGVLLTSCGDPGYDPRFDLNTDCYVNVLDVLLFPPYLLMRCTP